MYVQEVGITNLRTGEIGRLTSEMKQPLLWTVLVCLFAVTGFCLYVT